MFALIDLAASAIFWPMSFPGKSSSRSPANHGDVLFPSPKAVSLHNDSFNTIQRRISATYSSIKADVGIFGSRALRSLFKTLSNSYEKRLTFIAINVLQSKL